MGPEESKMRWREFDTQQGNGKLGVIYGEVDVHDRAGGRVLKLQNV